MSTQFGLFCGQEEFCFKRLLEFFRVTVWLFLPLCSCLRARACLCICRCSTPLSILCMGKLIICFLYPHHPLSQFGTHMLCLCRVTSQIHCSCSDSSPPGRGVSASVGTCTLRQSVWENSALFFFFEREFWGAVFFLRVAPHSGRVARPQQHMCCRPVYCLLAFFSGYAQEFSLLMYARVHTCACVCCIVSMQVRLP